MRSALLLAGWAGSPLLCWAQAAPRAVIPYVGASLSVQTSQPFNAYSSTRLGPAFTVGAELNPRLALQLGSAYVWRRDAYHGAYTTNVGLVVEDNDTRLHTFTVPILLRATLTRPAGRWHVDGLAGPTIYYYVTHRNYLQTTQGQITRSGTDSYVETQASLTLGPGVRYALTPRLELAANALAELYLSGFPYTLAAPLSSQLSSHLLAGVQYRFGQLRPPRPPASGQL
ncbi:porin family protein [Hymenobacter sp. RP-2-7]|uniref:Porin family protein n=1 Tax=Hymenobacter polaris TaxID=2682546 RepID=A0A7Y0ABL1_9BACT|nr:outer membrane beta-barrel protein [Hymenobacter polaris]NML64356.1 porin family protein [Hymenobacter polaris]